MIFEEKKLILKDGREAIFKTPEIEDAERMLDYIIKASGETDFLLRYPEEWDCMTIEQERAWVTRLRESDDIVAIACFIGGKIAGNCEINFRSGIKTGHRSSIAIAILKDYWNLGIGSAMFCEMIAAAQKHGTKIMELEFIEGNDRAKHLYEKFGFKIIAEIPNAIKLKGDRYLSEFRMQKYL